LCHWAPLAEQRRHHQEVIAETKKVLGLSKIETVIITHYHGDHVYNIPILIESEGAEVVTLDCIAPLVKNSRENNLAAPLWWYGVEFGNVPVHRILRDGEKFGWREYEMEFFHLGGQTKYHCGIEVTVDGEKVLFVGDALYGWKTECEPILTYNNAEPSSCGWLYACERMLEREPTLLVCGHGSTIRDPIPLLRIKCENWRLRMDDFDALNARGDRQAFFNPF
jgi:glyoxylase-like metal-dependent hydrolase (beta-lactamase superfamily II)